MALVAGTALALALELASALEPAGKLVAVVLVRVPAFQVQPELGSELVVLAEVRPVLAQTDRGISVRPEP